MKCFARAHAAGFQLPIVTEALVGSIETVSGSSTQKLNGVLVSNLIKDQCKALLIGRKVPKLVVVLIGDDPASHVYVRNKEAAFAQVGFETITVRFSENSSQDEIETSIKALAQDTSIHGILVQMPLPKILDSQRILSLVPASKDVDGYHPHNLGLLCAQDSTGYLPCTPFGVMVLLSAYGVNFKGKQTCVVGRSNTVGKPQGLLLLGEDSTVTFAHSKSTDLEKVTGAADVLVVAAGKPGLIGKDHVKRGAVVIDVGIHKNPFGQGLVGDVRAGELLNWASALSPVPGGVGPMTIAMLLLNTALAAWDPKP